MARRIFISGVAGFLGSHLADTFLADGCDVAGVDNLISGDRSNIPAGVSFKQADCNDLSEIAPMMRGAEIVYHCAATAYEGLSVFSPHVVSQNVVTASTSVISAAISAGARRFVFCSSMARYGANETPFREDMQPRPQDPYAIGKYAAELFLRNLADTHGMEWAIAVPHNIIGPRQKYDDPFRNVASIFINMMLQGRQPIIYGDGGQKRCFSDVADCVNPLKQMADDPQCASEVINIGPDADFITINELAQTVARLLEFELKPLHQPARPQEVYLANCSADKARRLLSYQPTTVLEGSLRRMIDCIKARGPRSFVYHLPLEIVTSKTPASWVQKLF